MHPLKQPRLIPTVLLTFIGSSIPLLAANPGLNETAHHIFQWRPFLAPFHAVVLHFPIGFLTGAFVLELYRWFRPGMELRKAAALFLWLSLLSGILAATFGLLRAEGGGYNPHAVAHHRLYGFLVLGSTLGTILLQSLANKLKPFFWTLIYRASLVATLGLLVVAGHLGGNLTHGSNYLVENAPEFVRTFLEGKSDEDSSPEARNQREQFYVEKVQPVFSTKCYSCHGPDKQKGRLRLDLEAAILKGGTSGKPAVKPGDPMHSVMVRLLLLPPAHDDVMPPDGKTPLTPEELGNVLQWIRDGAAFPKTPVASSPAAQAADSPSARN